MPAHMRPALTAALGALALAAGAPATAGAAFTIAPPSSKVTADAGGSAFGSFAVATKGARGSMLDVSVAEVSETADRGVAVAPGPQTREWLRASPRRFRVRRARHTVRWELAVPPGAEPGDHVLAVVVRTQPDAGRNNYASTQGVAHRITVRVPGAIRTDVSVARLSSPKVVGGGPVSATVEIVNRGNVSVDLGDARFAVVSNGRDRARARLDGSLVPDGSRRVTLTWQDLPRMGRARVEARAPDGSGLTSEITIVPWRESAALLLLAAALLIMVQLAKRRIRLQVVR